MACKQSSILMISALALTCSAGAISGHAQVAKSIDALLEQVGAGSSNGAMVSAFQTARRLSEMAPNRSPTFRADGDSIPTACKEVCPGAEAMQNEVASSQSPDMDMTIKETMDAVFTVMCKHSDALECMESNTQACAIERGGAPDMIGMGECFCTHCPNLKDAFPTFMEALMSQMSSGVTDPSGSSAVFDPNAALKLACPLVGGLKCAVNHAACASVTKEIPIMATGDIAAAEAACAQAGFATNTQDTSSTTSLKMSAWIATVVAGFSYAL